MKVPRGYKRMANGKLVKTTKAPKKKHSHKKKAPKKRQSGKGVGAMVIGAAKILGPAIVSGLISDEISKRLKKKGKGLKLMGMR